MSNAATETTPQNPPPAAATTIGRRRATNLIARGEPMVWLTGGCVVAAVLMIVALLGYITVNGFTTFWPLPVEQITLKNGKVLVGEPTRRETYRATSVGPGEAAAAIERVLYRTGNFDITGEDFTWVDMPSVREKQWPQWAMVIERESWGNAYGMLEGIVVSGREVRDPQQAWTMLQDLHPRVRKFVEDIHNIEKNEIGAVARQQNDLRLGLRRVELRHGKDSPQYRDMVAANAAKDVELQKKFEELSSRVHTLREQANVARLIIRAPGGAVVPADRSKPDQPMFVSQIVRVYPANQLGTGGRFGVYLSRWWEYLTADPREANTEGGVFPAIFGTVLLTFIMIIFVVPIGVITAIYLREYAKQGLLLSFVRICVNNLAGVPSIVFGVFGLGFFCYLIGGQLDKSFFPERLPDPTIGKSALIWASLTLALLTLPVVIVATEEALAAVPGSMREGSYACGASKWQTIRRIVLPRAMPGIMTGMILAIARGAGEVAPLMLVGAVKLAPELPISGHPGELFGINRSFMHLGFHIYDLGFQSRNSEAAKSMVYTTTFLLIGIVVLLNLAAMFIRTRLRKTYAGGQF